MEEGGAGHRGAEGERERQRLDEASAQGGVVGAGQPEPALGHRHHRLPRAACLGLRRPSPRHALARRRPPRPRQHPHGRAPRPLPLQRLGQLGRQ
eukprot:3941533-Rhodomonas_salina.1